MLGTYIDALPDGAKARMVRWQTWCSEWIIHEDDTSYRSLIGVAENWYGIRAHDWGAVEKGRKAVARSLGEWCPPAFACVLDRVGGRWDRLVERVGLEEAVRLVKKRAAKGNRELEEKILRQLDSNYDSALTY